MSERELASVLYDAQEYLVAGPANHAEWWEHLGDAHRDYAQLARVAVDLAARLEKLEADSDRDCCWIGDPCPIHNPVRCPRCEGAGDAIPQLPHTLGCPEEDAKRFYCDHGIYGLCPKCDAKTLWPV